MNKSLYDISLEYDESIRLVCESINKARTQLKKAKLSGDTDKIKKISGEMLVLYEEKRDMGIISERLKNYYGERNETALSNGTGG